jgi:hypothetical protein
MKHRLADGALLLALVLLASASPPAMQPGGFEFNDSHFHLTNYIQEGTNIRDFLQIMGNKTGRVALFGIPLQQQWSYRIDGNRAPKYYLTRTPRSITTPSRMRLSPWRTGL